MRIIRTIYIALMLVGMIQSLTTPLFAQSAFDSVFHAEAGRINENLEVFTDRSLYVVNERILFRADYKLQGLEGIPWSDVLYLELILASGQVFERAKHPITGGVSRGGLNIPPDLESGNYYLKCYTKWMRNSGPATFSYVPVKIVNPFRAGVVDYSNGNRNILPMERTSFSSGLLRIQSPARIFKRNGEARFELSVPGNASTEVMNCCVTIVPYGAVDTLEGQYTVGDAIPSDHGFSLEYLPDIGGASISGRLLHDDGTPGAHAILHFTLLGSDPGYYVTASDAQGRFVISTLGSEGGYEGFVAAKPYGENQIEVRIDQDFDPAEVQLPDREFTLPEPEREVARKMAIRMQLAETFKLEEAIGAIIPDTAGRDSVTFYGTPGFRLDLDEFIDLPNLEEVFANLVPVVSTVRRQGRRHFDVEGENSTIALYPPLVMVDLIPVFDQEAVMALAPERIRRIEVINEVFIRGNVTFGGVISILSRRGDMAGIDLPQGSYFFDFQALEPPVKKEAAPPAPGERIPDTRNTLLWLDDVTVQRGIPVEFRCIMPDQPGDFLIHVRGITPWGEVHSTTTRFKVE